jgi:hypothetical protein|tara:strand:- start:49 stop:159 length:111 start_codon:yes stop_codon:yes gene_type:complete
MDEALVAEAAPEAPEVEADDSVEEVADQSQLNGDAS